MQKVCIQGLGFVGAAMAVAVAVAMAKKDGAPRFDVVGIDLPNPQGQHRVDSVNAGRFAFETSDDSLTAAIAACHTAGNLRASTDPAEYQDADVILIDVHLDVDFDANPPAAKFDNFVRAIRAVGEQVRPDALVIVETTVPPGTTEKVVWPELKKALAERGLPTDRLLVAHSYERVMPGSEYLSSITNFWRVYSGTTPEAADACEAFLSKVINIADYPLTRLARTADSETAKVMENSYRAVNIAFVDEWSRFAERAGVDLGSVISAIKMRPTHNNIMRPGFGVGGYCLTKDPLLVGVGARDLFGLKDLSFPFSEMAVRTNDAMPQATVALVRDALGTLQGKRILLLGASYRPGVADTRYSPSTSFVEAAEAEGAVVSVQDPMVDQFDDTPERKVSKTLPAPGDFDALVFAVAHDAYRALGAHWLAGSTPLVVDANGVLSADQITGFAAAGCAVRQVGKG